MRTFSLGDRFDPEKTSWEVGWQYTYALNQHWITLVWNDITLPEVVAIDSGPLQFALYAEDDQILLFLKLGDASGWIEMPFTLWLVNANERTVPEPPLGNEHALLTLLLISAEMGRIVAMRALTISAEMTTALLEALRRQAALPWDPSGYDARLSAVRERYPSPELLVADHQMVHLRCNGGD